MFGKLARGIVDSATRVALAALACAILAGIAKFVIVGILVRFEIPSQYLRLQDSVLTGIFTAIGVWAAFMIVRERRRVVLRQVETVAALNHELRNALEVILGSDYLANSKQGEAILSSVERINRTLDSILERPGSKP